MSSATQRLEYRSCLLFMLLNIYILHGGVIAPSRGWKLVLGGQRNMESLLTSPTQSWNSSITQLLGFMPSPPPRSFFQIFHGFTPPCPSALNLNHAKWVSIIICLCVYTFTCTNIVFPHRRVRKISKSENLEYLVLLYILIAQCLWQNTMWISFFFFFNEWVNERKETCFGALNSLFRESTLGESRSLLSDLPPLPAWHHPCSWGFPKTQAAFICL